MHSVRQSYADGCPSPPGRQQLPRTNSATPQYASPLSSGFTSPPSRTSPATAPVDSKTPSPLPHPLPMPGHRPWPLPISFFCLGSISSRAIGVHTTAAESDQVMVRHPIDSSGAPWALLRLRAPCRSTVNLQFDNILGRGSAYFFPFSPPLLPVCTFLRNALLLLRVPYRGLIGQSPPLHNESHGTNGEPEGASQADHFVSRREGSLWPRADLVLLRVLRPFPE